MSILSKKWKFNIISLDTCQENLHILLPYQPVVQLQKKVAVEPSCKDSTQNIA